MVLQAKPNFLESGFPVLHSAMLFSFAAFMKASIVANMCDRFSAFQSLYLFQEFERITVYLFVFCILNQVTEGNGQGIVDICQSPYGSFR